MGRFSIASRFLKFYTQATTVYNIHSPFVYQFVINVLEDNRIYYAFQAIEELRQLLKQNKTKIQVTDFGAGSHVNNNKERSISSIVNSAVTDARNGQILFKVIHHFKPKTILEIGTSLGITTLYQAKALQKSRVITLEGCPNIATVAKQNFEVLEASNIDLIVGEFSATLPKVIQKSNTLDYVFFDGNHQKAATLSYFSQCLEIAHEHSVFVFDDIHWSEDMEAAWYEIQNHPNVTLTIDLFFMGFVFFKKSNFQQKHLKLVPTRWKPWVMGFF